MNKPQIILGIDPGLATTGFGIIKYTSHTPTLIDYGAIITKAKTEFSDRLVEIHKQLHDLIEKYQPQAMGCEKLFFCNNAKTAIDVGQARGVILLTAKQHHLNLCEFTPLQVKQSLTGYGQASKQQIQKMVKACLCLKKIPKPDDAADALAIAITCAQYINSPLYDKNK
ncbi:MAG: crossover junction endodeoxyribonuclease RuvC [Patescibacteria group bacterium]